MAEFIVKEPITKENVFEQPYTIQKGKNKGKTKTRKVIYVTVTGYRDQGPFESYDKASEWILNHQPQSLHYAMNIAGYKIVEVYDPFVILREKDQPWEFKAEEEGRKAAKALGSLMNSMHDKMAIAAFVDEVTRVEHRTLQQSIMRLFFATMKGWASNKRKGWFDLRNEDTVNISDKIITMLDERDGYFRHV